MAYSEADNVSAFSQLREMGHTGPIVAFVVQAFPFITNLEVLALAGAPGIFATLDAGGLRRLQLVSAGVNRVISILLACANTKKGVILIDEIENGVFYEKYEMTWSILYDFAKRFDCQLFVTSHSDECLEALVPVIGENADDFSLLRAERENGFCIVRHISGVSMRAALKRGGEIRGATIASKTHNHN